MMLHTCIYHGSRPSGFRQEALFMFSLYKPMQNYTWDHNLNKLVSGPLDDATCQIQRL